MDKQQTLELLKQKINDGTISVSDINSAFSTSIPVEQSSQKASSENFVSINNIKIEENHSSVGEKVIHALYLIGAIIIITGVIIMLVQNWDEIGFLGRVVSTSGIALLAYILGLITHKGENINLSQISFLVSSIVFPIGIIVLIDELNLDVDIDTFLLNSFLLALLYSITQYIVRNRILVLVITFFSTVLYFSLIYKILDIYYILDSTNLIKIAVIALGLSYCSIAYGYTNSLVSIEGKLSAEENSVSNILYILGSFVVLIPMVTYKGLMDLVSIIVIIAISYLGIFLKSKIIFFISAIFLIIQIVSLTWEYFEDSFGWPFLLILIGAIIIGVAYASIKLSKSIK